MKQLLFIVVLLISTVLVQAQAIIDLGLKAGVNISKISFDSEDYTSESITKAHFGAFGRLGWGRVFVQPEVYFSAKGGDLSSNVFTSVTAFDYNTVDVPLLFGVNIIKGKVNVHAIGGPVFSFLTTTDIKGDVQFTQDYFEDRYLGIQYGVGVEILSFSLSARIEQTDENIYSHPSLRATNNTFLVTAGFKFF